MGKSDDVHSILKEPLDKQDVHGGENNLLEEPPEPAEVSVSII